MTFALRLMKKIVMITSSTLMKNTTLKKILEISEQVCRIIDAEVLNVSLQDYDPHGASTMVLMSDIAGGKWEDCAPQVNMHLDKSHITAHTYPDASDPEGICSFRVDIDVATCGDIIPLNAINYLIESFECDVVYVDYVVRGFTRCKDGSKIYNDHHFNSIQDFIKPEVLSDFKYRSDINLGNANTWQTKLMVKDFGPEKYVLNPQDVNHPEIDKKMHLLHQEMKEVYHLS
jgi:S-adenosylmethionine decarboxylase